MLVGPGTLRLGMPLRAAQLLLDLRLTRVKDDAQVCANYPSGAGAKAGIVSIPGVR
jgi:hypothetical protein